LDTANDDASSTLKNSLFDHILVLSLTRPHIPVLVTGGLTFFFAGNLALSDTANDDASSTLKNSLFDHILVLSLTRPHILVLVTGGLTFFFAGNLALSDTLNGYSEGVRRLLYNAELFILLPLSPFFYEASQSFSCCRRADLLFRW